MRIFCGSLKIMQVVKYFKTRLKSKYFSLKMDKIIVTARRPFLTIVLILYGWNLI